MTLPLSGPLSLGDIANEKGVSLSNVSLEVESTQNINTASPFFPDGVVPHAISEFYGYQHTFSEIAPDNGNEVQLSNNHGDNLGARVMCVHAMDNPTNLVFLYRRNSTTALNLGSMVIDSSGVVTATGTELQLTADAGTSPVISKISATRYIAAFRNNANSGRSTARLFDYSSSTGTFTLVGTETQLSTQTNTAATDIVYIKDNLAFKVGNRGGTGVIASRISISGTTIAFDNEQISFQIAAGASTTKFIKTGTDSGFIITQRRPGSTGRNRYIDYISVSDLNSGATYGTRTQLEDVGTQSILQLGAKYIGNDHSLICWTESTALDGDGKHYVKLVKTSGTSLTDEDQVSSTNESDKGDIDAAVHDIIVITTVGDLVYFVSKVGAEIALFGTANTNTSEIELLDELFEFGPEELYTTGSMINVDPAEENQHFLIIGNNGTTLRTFPLSAS